MLSAYVLDGSASRRGTSKSLLSEFSRFTFKARLLKLEYWVGNDIQLAWPKDSTESSASTNHGEKKCSRLPILASPWIRPKSNDTMGTSALSRWIELMIAGPYTQRNIFSGRQ